MSTLYRACAIAAIALSTTAAVGAEAGPGKLSTEMVQRSLVSMGDTARLQHVMAKARRGEKIVVGTIGGSITAGAAATTPENRWADLVAKWWTVNFPKAEVQFVNAGIGATGSDIGSHRVKEHLLKSKPDFVVVEYAVNDWSNDLGAETVEGVVRQILKQPNKPAVMMLFMTNTDGGNVQAGHSRVGRHYGLPMASFRDAFYPEFQAGSMTWHDVIPDTIHPNDWGHGCAAKFITNILDKTLAALPADDKLPKVKGLPKPLISDVFEHTAMYNATTLTPTSADGWKPSEAWMFGKCWEADKPGSTIEFQVTGTAISLLYLKIPSDMGIAEARVDDQPPVKLDAAFPGGFGGYSAWGLVARGLTPGTHRLRVTILHEKNPQSHGHRFQIQSVMTAGMR